MFLNYLFQWHSIKTKRIFTFVTDICTENLCVSKWNIININILFMNTLSCFIYLSCSVTWSTAKYFCQMSINFGIFLKKYIGTITDDLQIWCVLFWLWLTEFMIVQSPKISLSQFLCRSVLLDHSFVFYFYKHSPKTGWSSTYKPDACKGLLTSC